MQALEELAAFSSSARARADVRLGSDTDQPSGERRWDSPYSAHIRPERPPRQSCHEAYDLSHRGPRAAQPASAPSTRSWGRRPANES
jgi:hypothetical protein